MSRKSLFGGKTGSPEQFTNAPLLISILISFLLIENKKYFGSISSATLLQELILDCKCSVVDCNYRYVFEKYLEFVP